jgi:hypothetical protein
VAESRDQRPGLEQVCQQAQQTVVLRGPLLAGLILRRPTGSLYRHERPALIRQDQPEVETAGPVRMSQNGQGPAFKGMALANDSDLVGNVFERGSVS